MRQLPLGEADRLPQRSKVHVQQLALDLLVELTELLGSKSPRPDVGPLPGFHRQLPPAACLRLINVALPGIAPRSPRPLGSMSRIDHLLSCRHPESERLDAVDRRRRRSAVD